MALSGKEKAQAEVARKCATDALPFLRALVEVNSGSRNLAGIEKVGDLVKPRFEALGFDCRWATPARGHGREKAARSLVARRGKTGPKLFLTAHLDTVFEPEQRFEGYRVEDPKAIGPGIVDCKGGVALMLAALQALGRELPARIAVVLGGDEETGSYESRGVIEEEAAGSDYALVFEGGRPDGSIVVYRSGNGGYELRAQGRAAHSGTSHKEGINAILALAHAVIDLEALTDHAREALVNVGTIRGGTKRNVVPGEGEALIDIRYATPEDGAALDQAIRKIAAKEQVKGARLLLSGGLNRPPYPKASPGIAELAKRWIAAAADCGVAETAGPTGGGSDGNWTAAMGIPTLDGLGPVGGNYHTVGEYLLLESLPARAAVAAVGISRLVAGA